MKTMNKNLAKFLTIPVLGLLSACNGPWNMSVEEPTADKSLWVSSVQVAGRAFDTVWIEDLSPLERTFDASVPVALPASTVRVFQDSAGVRDTVTFVSSSSLPRAWVPRSEDAGKKVRWGATLEFSARAVLADGSVRDLSASTYTQRYYSLSDSFSVPLEALHPQLANGEFRLALAATNGDTAKVFAELLKFDPTFAFTEKWKLTVDDLTRFAQGLPVMRNVAMKGAKLDTLWYISSLLPVQGPTIDGVEGKWIPGEYRPWIFRHTIDKERFGGLVLTQGFDPTRARIFGSIYQQFGQTFSNRDSSGLFQRGDTRSWLVAPKVYDDLPGWPDSAALANNYFGYTGKNRVYAWAVDSLYYEFYRTITGETGDGQYSVTNVKGGKGFFTGAGLDSVAFHLEASKIDTVAVSRLQTIWCDSTIVRQKRGESSSIPKTQVAQFCGDR